MIREQKLVRAFLDAKRDLLLIIFALYGSGGYDAFGKILSELLKHNLTAQTELFDLF